MRRHKYGAIRAQASNGIWCASKKEARRYSELLLLEKFGKIKDLKFQVKCPVSVQGTFVFDVVMDFIYWDHEKEVPVLTYEDCKGFLTPVYRVKKKCFEAQYRTKILET